MADDPKERDEDGGDEPEGKKLAEEAEAAGEGGTLEPKQALAREGDAEGGEGDGDDDEEAVLPGQMGYRRYIYAVYFVIGICLAYFMSKAGLAVWHRLSQWTPKVGEPREDLMTPIAALIAGVIIWFTYRRADVKNLSDEVALELSKVEWPSRAAVRRSTTIVVLTTLGASMAFWLYDIGANSAIGFIAESTKTWHVILRVVGGAVAIYVVRALGIRFLAGTTSGRA